MKNYEITNKTKEVKTYKNITEIRIRLGQLILVEDKEIHTMFLNDILEMKEVQ